MGGALFALLLATAGHPSAKTLARARALTVQSIREYNVGQLDRALADATEAYLLSGLPALLFNLGQCERALGKYAKAEAYYREYLRDEPRAANRAEVLALIAKVHAEAAQAAAPPARAPMASRAGERAPEPGAPAMATAARARPVLVTTAPARPARTIAAARPEGALSGREAGKVGKGRRRPLWMAATGAALLAGGAVAGCYAGWGFDAAGMAAANGRVAPPADQQRYKSNVSGLTTLGAATLATSLVLVAGGVTLLVMGLPAR